jgi:diadenylate cyclase
VQLNNSDILSEFGQFISKLFTDMTNGLLFFGGPLDITVAVLDILVTALVIYYILKILRDSRAWQLLKGLILIIGFAVVCSLAGLSTVGFLLNNTISVLAIAFVVIFQPELRRALEAFGRSSFNVLSGVALENPTGQSGSVHNLIESIVRACEKMAETRTGSLIIIERQTKLSELIEQENVVQLDAAVSATMLMQIFYKGSPLHDGAVLIRDGRLTAARIHVPLSDNYHVRKDFGTRHRAAVGASEMGDAISIIVSEEHGTIGVAIEGRLYFMANSDALRTLLHKLLGSQQRTGALLGGFFRSNRRLARVPNSEDIVSADDITDNETASGSASQGKQQAKTRQRRGPHFPIGRQRLLLFLSSLAIAVVLWLYVQVTYNPVSKRVFVVSLTYHSVEVAENKGFEPIMSTPHNIQVTMQARKNIIDKLTSDDITAYVDCSQIEGIGNVQLKVMIETGSLMYMKPTLIDPVSVTIQVIEKTTSS